MKGYPKREGCPGTSDPPQKPTNTESPGKRGAVCQPGAKGTPPDTHGLHPGKVWRHLTSTGKADSNRYREGKKPLRCRRHQKGGGQKGRGSPHPFTGVGKRNTAGGGAGPGGEATRGSGAGGASGGEGERRAVAGRQGRAWGKRLGNPKAPGREQRRAQRWRGGEDTISPGGTEGGRGGPPAIHWRVDRRGKGPHKRASG